MDDIPFYTLKHWEENFDHLLERVENGETLGIINEDGNKAVMVPADDELIRLYTDHEEGSWGTVAYRLRPTAYNGVNWVQLPAVLSGV